MNIKKFLSGGTTHVHTDEPKGNFTKSTAAMLVLFGLSVAYAYDNATFTSKMPFAGDKTSLMYQALVEPDRWSRIRIVSTKSDSLNQMIKSLPLQIQAEMYIRNDPLMSGDNKANDLRLDARSIGANSLITKQSLCIVNASENVAHYTKAKNDYKYVELSSFSKKPDMLSEMVVLSESEMTTITTLHELAHCAAFIDDVPSLDSETREDNLFAEAFRESIADLAVIMFYASKEGSFTNGKLAVGALRSNLYNADHATRDITDLALSEFDAEDFLGMTTQEIFDQAPKIMSSLYNRRSNDVKQSFWTETYESRFLDSKVFGYDWSGQLIDKKMKANISNILEIDFIGNPVSRANKILDQLLNNALRNQDLNRTTGKITIKNMNALATSMGVELSPEQVAKTRFVDPAFSPPGTKGSSGFKSDTNLREVDYLRTLKQEANQIINTKMVNAPRFN